jgi:hypothetical protein
MVTSKWPVVDPSRPGVRGHLPFVPSEEAVYRAAAMYWTRKTSA